MLNRVYHAPWPRRFRNFVPSGRFPYAGLPDLSAMPRCAGISRGRKNCTQGGLRPTLKTFRGCTGGTMASRSSEQHWGEPYPGLNRYYHYSSLCHLLPRPFSLFFCNGRNGPWPWSRAVGNGSTGEGPLRMEHSIATALVRLYMYLLLVLRIEEDWWWSCRIDDALTREQNCDAKLLLR